MPLHRSHLRIIVQMFKVIHNRVLLCERLLLDVRFYGIRNMRRSV